MNKRKGIAAILVSVMVLALLAGCAKKFDASGYTKSILDLYYKGETEQYVKLTQTTKEKAEEQYTQNLDQMVEELSEWELSDELMEKFRGFLADLNKNVKYTVGEAKEDKDGNFTVDVTVEPIMNLTDAVDVYVERYEEYTQKLMEDVENGAKIPTEEEILNDEIELYYNVLRESLDSGVKYGDAETVTMHVQKNSDNKYEIPQEDFKALEALTMSTDFN